LLGVTARELPITVPIFGPMLRLVAPETFHDSVLDVPPLMLEGFAVKLVITGRREFTVTVVVAVTEPALFVAVRV
jgi:hypothetical protein